MFAIRALQKVDKADPETVEVMYQVATTDSDETIRDRAFSWLKRYGVWPDRPEAIAWLREHAAGTDYVCRQDDDYSTPLRDFPAKATLLLAHLRYNDVDIRAWLHDLLVTSTDGEFRDGLLRQLSTDKRHNGQIAAMARRMLASDPSPAVRATAALF